MWKNFIAFHSELKILMDSFKVVMSRAPAPAGAKRGTGAGAKNLLFFPEFFMEVYDKKLEIPEGVVLKKP